MYVRFSQAEIKVGEADGSVEIIFEALSQVSEGVFVPINSPTDFELLVRTSDGSAVGKDACVCVYACKQR